MGMKVCVVGGLEERKKKSRGRGSGLLALKVEKGEETENGVGEKGKVSGDRPLVSHWPRTVLKVEKSEATGGRRLP